jgi:hypothetical protein
MHPIRYRRLDPRSRKLGRIAIWDKKTIDHCYNRCVPTNPHSNKIVWLLLATAAEVPPTVSLAILFGHSFFRSSLFHRIGVHVFEFEWKFSTFSDPSPMGG